MPLRAGLLNMMPDKALAVTERQFARLLGLEAGAILKYTLPEIPRGSTVLSHLNDQYRPVTEIASDSLDVLVFSGANVSDPELSRQVFWQSLTGLFDWALAAEVPTLCSCLATHAVLAHRHGQARKPAPAKVWGVFLHQVMMPQHPLLKGLPADVWVPHSRHNGIDSAQFEFAGYDVLLAGDDAGAHLALEREHGRWLLLQGHPEYDGVSLLKEYKREVQRWQAGARADYPPLPAGYFGPGATRRLEDYRRSCEVVGSGAAASEPFPENDVAPQITNTWCAAARKTVANWLGQ